jgi:heme/copper-type cytochrome/quinol oxidase subunit 2
MNKKLLPLMTLMGLCVLGILAIQNGLTHTVSAVSPLAEADNKLNYQIAPTETPQAEDLEQDLATNPILIQLIILLGILTVLIIFVGVWVNR